MVYYFYVKNPYLYVETVFTDTDFLITVPMEL